MTPSPVPTLVKLNTGEVAVVLRAYAGDPHRPRVRVIGRLGNGTTADAEPVRLSPVKAYDVNLWESAVGGQWPETIVAPLDAAEYGIDPLTLI